MRPEDLREANEWIERAEYDLEMAEVALERAPPLAGGAAFHAQQAAEKALKSFLAAHGRTFPRTHQLIPPLTDCEAIDTTFQKFTAAAQSLTPYAVEFRYPGGRKEPPETEAEAAFQAASDLVRFVRSRLPSGPHGSSEVDTDGTD